MRAVIQRVASASVAVEGETIGAIGRGLLVLVGKEDADTAGDIDWLAAKIIGLRIFPDEAGAMHRSVRDIGGDILLVSQFTLFASTRKGARPSFNDAAKPDHAIPLYEKFLAQAGAALGGPPALSGAERIAHGEFGAMMQVALVNDGPVTLVIDSQLRE